MLGQLFIEKYLFLTDNEEDAIKIIQEYLLNKEIINKNNLYLNKFPFTHTCPICNIKLIIKKVGRGKCKNCKTVLKVDSLGEVFLG
jgi:Zn finger protein HypA/HybF involved in hydrogenase expression